MMPLESSAGPSGGSTGSSGGSGGSSGGSGVKGRLARNATKEGESVIGDMSCMRVVVVVFSRNDRFYYFI